MAWRAWAVIAPYKFGIGIAFLTAVITQTAHSEFIEYLQVQASIGANASSVDNVEETLQLAYLAKWSSFLLIAVVFLLYVWRVGGQSQALEDRAFDFLRDVDSPARETIALESRAGLDPSENDQQQSAKGEAESVDCVEVMHARDDEDKSFDFLREKPRLRKRGEMILDKKSSRD